MFDTKEFPQDYKLHYRVGYIQHLYRIFARTNHV